MTQTITAGAHRLLSRTLLASGIVRAWLFTAVVAGASAQVWLHNLHGPGAPGRVSLPWWALAVAFYLAEVWVVHLHFRKQAHTLSLTELGLVFGLFFAAPASLLAAQVVGAGAALALHRRQKAVKLAFNLAEQSLCAGLALLVFHAVLGGGASSSIRMWAAALAAAAFAHTLGVLLVSAVIAVAEGNFAAPQLARTLGITLVGASATACVALVGVELVNAKPVALTLLVLPTLACGFAFRGYMTQREQREHMEFLYESMRAAQGSPEFGLAIGQLLVAARRLLRAEYAEILLMTPGAGDQVLRSVSGPAGELLMHPEPLTTAVELVFEQTIAADRSILLPRNRQPHPVDSFLAVGGLTDALLGALMGEERVFGVLVVGTRTGDVSTFDENDLALFETFAGHASVLLENGRLEQTLAQLTELKEELRHQAHHDALTGLPNRVLFTERVTETLTGAGAEGEHAILFLDLDRFKFVNDSWGHGAGDALLVHVAERLRGTIRPQDTPARLGGDEFAVLLTDTDARGAEHAAQRVVDALNATFSVHGRDVNVSASIGIALTGPHATTSHELLRNADLAMYVAKSAERCHFATYEPSLHTRIRHRQELGLELKRALDRDEIVVNYQPVVSLVDGRIRAFEALARWRHPRRGLLDPGEFLDVAEENGLIVDLGAKVLEQALRCAGVWEGEVPESADIGLWINLSPGEFANERLVEDLALALTKSRFNPRRLTVEITESSVMRDETSAITAMQRLRELGVSLSIDDFGTGYSSLSRLADFPIGLLKIPKPFVERLSDDVADATFADAILHLAMSLGLEAVGEGIETEAQAEKLRRLGCPLGQGYLFSRPLTADESLELLRAGAAGGRLLGQSPVAVAV